MSAAVAHELVRARLAAATGATGPLDLDLDRDLLDPDGYEVGGHVLDSLTLVEVLAALEDEAGVSLQDVLDRDGPLTLRRVIDRLAGPA